MHTLSAQMTATKRRLSKQPIRPTKNANRNPMDYPGASSLRLAQHRRNRPHLRLDWNLYLVPSMSPAPKTTGIHPNFLYWTTSCQSDSIIQAVFDHQVPPFYLEVSENDQLTTRHVPCVCKIIHRDSPKQKEPGHDLLHCVVTFRVITSAMEKIMNGLNTTCKPSCRTTRMFLDNESLHNRTLCPTIHAINLVFSYV